jgi:NAD(P)-dependent dehydrogenase (short-subunit alcohol dehydrogenase family)
VEIQGTTVLVTGANRGISRAIASYCLSYLALVTELRFSGPRDRQGLTCGRPPGPFPNRKED